VPFLTEFPLQLSLFTADKEIDERNVNRGRDEGRGRSEEQCRTEENEYVSAEIERIPRKAIRAGRNQRILRLKRDNAHLARIEMDRRPDTYEKPERQKQQGSRLRERGSEPGNSQKRVCKRASVRDRQSDSDDADVVKNALEKIDGH